MTKILAGKAPLWFIPPERLTRSMRRLDVVYFGERSCVVDPNLADEARPSLT